MALTDTFDWHRLAAAAAAVVREMRQQEVGLHDIFRTMPNPTEGLDEERTAAITGSVQAMGLSFGSNEKLMQVLGLGLEIVQDIVEGDHHSKDHCSNWGSPSYAVGSTMVDETSHAARAQCDAAAAARRLTVAKASTIVLVVIKEVLEGLAVRTNTNTNKNSTTISNSIIIIVVLVLLLVLHSGMSISIPIINSINISTSIVLANQ